MANQTNQTNQNQREAFNVIENWGLRCFEQKVSERSVTLRCTMNSKVPNTESEYTAPIYIDVICILGDCDIEEDDYAKSNINVWGTFKADGFTDKSGNKRASMKIFASKVRKR